MDASTSGCDMDPNPEVDRSQCIQMFIPVNSVINIKAVKQRFSRFGRVEVVPQDSNSGIRHILYIQPTQVQNVPEAASQIAISEQHDPLPSMPSSS